MDIDGSRAIIAYNIIVSGIQFNLHDEDGNEWSDSNLRSWLNSKEGQDVTGDTTDFYNAAFNESEKVKIEMTDVSMKSDTNYIAYNRLIQIRNKCSTTGTDTKDYI